MKLSVTLAMISNRFFALTNMRSLKWLKGTSVVVLRVERALYIHSPPIPAGPRLEPATFGLRVRLSTIRPRLSRLVYRIILLFVRLCLGNLHSELNSVLPLSFSQSSQPDELTIDEHEMLEVIEDGDMEDWVKVI